MNINDPKNKDIKRRLVLDWGVTQFIRVGGVFVVVTVVLIFLYLIYKAFPLFSGIEIKESTPPVTNFSLQDENTLYYGLDEYSSILYSVQKNGSVAYFDLDKNKLRTESIAPTGLAISYINASNRVDQLPTDRYVVAATDKNNKSVAFVVNHTYEVSYPNGVKTVTPKLRHPWADQTLAINNNTTKIALREDDSSLILATVSKNKRSVSFYHYAKEESLIEEKITFDLQRQQLLSVNHAIDFLLVSFDLRWLIAISKDGSKTFFPTYENDMTSYKHEILNTQNTVSDRITQVVWLLGGISLLIGNEQGQIEQWFPVQQGTKTFYKKIRSFEFSQTPISTLVSQYQHKGFVVTDVQGNAGLFYTSSESHLGTKKVSEKALLRTVISPQGDNILFLDANFKWHRWHVNNPHPEGNLTQIWSKIHYENYSEPRYLWQSSAANQDFEPKFSLTPLFFGTLKGAFYAMIFAIPLAIFGAIYTGFFMSSNMRRYVKPGIEIMEALPTVILGFLAGLWMAPFVEKNLMLLINIFFILPIGVLAFGYFSVKLSDKENTFFSMQNRFLSLIPVVILLFLLSQLLADPFQNLFFNGDIRQFITQELGITYNQRNALVVGFAMGFAVIPTIFSITEDAIYSVPKHLVNGSLALGSSPWQTLKGVVIPTASPAIFSAIMIGFGRAVGETMIVLMATGNTPVMDFNIFEGMRTLSANIAVEMPESEVDGTHFRILFLAALLLFIFTFVFNTIAETIRIRLKKKYSEI